MAAPLHRHKSSLEGVFSLNPRPPLDADERNNAERRFYTLIERFGNESDNRAGYDRSLLLRHTYEYALSQDSKDNILRAFFDVVGLPIDEDGNDGSEDVGPRIFEFADHIVHHFFLPCKISQIDY